MKKFERPKFLVRDSKYHLLRRRRLDGTTVSATWLSRYVVPNYLTSNSGPTGGMLVVSINPPIYKDKKHYI